MIGSGSWRNGRWLDRLWIDNRIRCINLVSGGVLPLFQYIQQLNKAGLVHHRNARSTRLRHRSQRCSRISRHQHSRRLRQSTPSKPQLLQTSIPRGSRLRQTTHKTYTGPFTRRPHTTPGNRHHIHRFGQQTIPHPCRHLQTLRHSQQTRTLISIKHPILPRSQRHLGKETQMLGLNPRGVKTH